MGELGFRRTCERCGSDWDASVAFCPRDGQGLGQAKLDRYLLIRAVAHSGMSEVFEAEHEHTKRRVALKLISAEMAAQDDTAERLRREGRAASAMGHPNVVDITDFGITDDGGVYLVMEWLDGKTIREVLNAGPVDRGMALDLAAQTASGLASAHSIGVIHRDIKPENLMVMDGEDGAPLVKILDFGVAKVAGPEIQKLTQTGTIVGTPAYMSPEQARGEPVDARSDIYSLGCLIYELFTGEPPFTSPSVMEVVLMHVDAEPTLPSAFAPLREIPPAIDRVIMRCLVKEPKERFSSMGELRNELLTLHKGGLALPVKKASEEIALDTARTLHFKSAQNRQEPSAAAQPAQVLAPEADVSPGLSRSRLPLFVGLVLVAGVAVAATAILTSGKEPDTVVGEAEGTDAAAITAARPSEAGKGVGAAEVGRTAQHPDAGPMAPDGGSSTAVSTQDAGAARAVTPWQHEDAHSKFKLVVTASPALSPRAPIELGFQLSDLKKQLSWAVTEGRLRARVEFVHFVSHDTMGRVTADVDDTGKFQAILSVPQTGKYHLRIRLSDGTKVVGRSRVDICVGARPGSSEAESLCPKLNEYSHRHKAAR